jgi:hypothetical protein
MVMRYHWGHGVGHTYSHQSQNIWKTDNAGSEGNAREREVRQENVPQMNRSGPQAEGHVTSHPNEENEGTRKGDEEAGDDDDESDRESYDDYGSEDDDYDYCDADDVSEESDEISDDDIE